MKKGIKNSISSFLAAAMMSGSFVFVPFGLGDIDLGALFSMRDPGTAQVLTYDESTSKYYADGTEIGSDFPTSGEFILEADIPIKTSRTISSGSFSIDLNGYDIIDQCTGGSSLFLISGGVFTLSDSTFDLDSGTGGSLLGASNGHRAFEVKSSGTLNIEGGYIENFSAGNNSGGGLYITDKNDNAVINMSGGVIRNCKAGSNGGGVSIQGGTFTMSGNACITECRTTVAGTEKNGNGAGLSAGTSSKVYIRDNASIINNTGTGFHGAGVDFWGTKYTCTLEISGSPVITGNMNGHNYECNLYCGKAVSVGTLNLSRDSEGNVIPQVGITIQQSPVFTIGIADNNPGETIEDLDAFFYADRKTAGSKVPHSETYDIKPTDDNKELKQTPTIHATFLIPSVSSEGGFKEYTTIECVPGGYIGKSDMPKNYNITNHSFKGWNTQSGKFVSNFKEDDTTTGYDDFNLYGVLLPQVNGYSLCSFEDGSIGLKGFVCYDEDLGFITSDATATVTGFTSNPNPSESFTVDASDIVTVGNNKYICFTFKFNPYDMTKQFLIKVKFANGYELSTSVQPSVIGAAVVKGSGYGGNQYRTQAAKQLGSSMLIFGASLQTQLGYYFNNADDLATTGVTNLLSHDPISSVPNLPEKSVTDDESNALTFYGSSVVYNTNIQIKQYIKLNGEDASDYTFSVDGQGSYAFELDNSGKYMYAKVDVPAYDMDHLYEITVKDGSGAVVMTIDYSIYNYIDSVINNKQGTPIYDTVQALYWYGVDAKAYAGV